MNLTKEELTRYSNKKQFLLNKYKCASGWHKLVSLSLQLNDLILSGKKIELFFETNGLHKSGKFSYLNEDGMQKGIALCNFIELNIDFDEDLDPTEKEHDGLQINLCVKDNIDSLEYLASCFFAEDEIQAQTANELKEMLSYALPKFKDSVFLDPVALLEKLSIDLTL